MGSGAARMVGVTEDLRHATIAPGLRPTMPSGPYLFPVSRRLKLAYVICALCIAVLATFAEFLYATDIAYLAGPLHLTNAQAAWGTALYYGFGASNALFVIKGRMQFGTARFFHIVIGFYAATSLLFLVHPTFVTLLINRAANGAVYSMAIAKAVYYLLVVVPADKRYRAPMIAIGALLTSSSLVGLVPIDPIASDGALGFRLICLAAPCIMLTLVLLFPLTPTDRFRVFNWGDLVTVLMAVPGVLLLAGALAQGRTYWWSQVPWLGWMIAAGIALVAGAMIREHRRGHPLLQIEWMTSRQFLMLIFVVVFERIGLAEQTTGVRGLMASLGFDSDQLHALSIASLLGQVGGVTLLARFFKPERAGWVMLGCLLATAAASWTDGGRNGFATPQDVLVTQFVIGGASVVFVASGLLFMVGKVMASGPHNLVTMIVMFAFTQNIGGLIGSALIGSYQFVAQQSALTVLASWSPLASPYLAGGASQPAISSLISSGAATLGYLDAFRFVGVLTAGGGACLLIYILAMRGIEQVRRTKA